MNILIWSPGCCLIYAGDSFQFSTKSEIILNVALITVINCLGGCLTFLLGYIKKHARQRRKQCILWGGGMIFVISNFICNGVGHRQHFCLKLNPTSLQLSQALDQKMSPFLKCPLALRKVKCASDASDCYEEAERPRKLHLLILFILILLGCFLTSVKNGNYVQPDSAQPPRRAAPPLLPLWTNF